MFINYLTLMLVLVAGGLVLLVAYGARMAEPRLESRRNWVAPLGLIGAALSLLSLQMVLTWPLPGPYNVVFGEPALLLGLLLLGLAFSIQRGLDLMPLAYLGALAALVPTILSLAIFSFGLTSMPPMAGLAYLATGLGGLTSPLALRQAGFWRNACGALLLVGAVLLGATGYMAYFLHTGTGPESIGGWVPAPGR